jgi:hypothetical protein
MTLIIISSYIIVALAYEVIYLFIAWKSVKNRASNSLMVEVFKQHFLSSATGRNFKKKYWNWYTKCFIVIPAIIIICLFIFPIDIFHRLNKLIFGGSRLQKMADAEKMTFEELQKKEDERLHSEIAVADDLSISEKPIKEPVSKKEYIGIESFYMAKESFWNDIEKDYPGEIKIFREWIDAYKQRINWGDLFPIKQRNHYWADIKFHHLPDAMQIGIFYQYTIETPCQYPFTIEDNDSIRKIADNITEWFCEEADLKRIQDKEDNTSFDAEEAQ